MITVVDLDNPDDYVRYYIRKGETADVTVTVGNLVAVIGCGIATTLTINANVTNISLESTEADTKVQIVVKGVN